MPTPNSWVESLLQLQLKYALQYSTRARQLDIYGGFTNLDAKNEDMSRRARRANKLYKQRREHDSANNPRHTFDRGRHQPKMQKVDANTPRYLSTRKYISLYNFVRFFIAMHIFALAYIIFAALLVQNPLLVDTTFYDPSRRGRVYG